MFLSEFSFTRSEAAPKQVSLARVPILFLPSLDSLSYYNGWSLSIRSHLMFSGHDTREFRSWSQRISQIRVTVIENAISGMFDPHRRTLGTPRVSLLYRMLSHSPDI